MGEWAKIMGNIWENWDFQLWILSWWWSLLSIFFRKPFQRNPHKPPPGDCEGDLWFCSFLWIFLSIAGMPWSQALTQAANLAQMASSAIETHRPAWQAQRKRGSLGQKCRETHGKTMFFLGDMAVCLMGNLWFKATVCGVRCTFQ